MATRLIDLPFTSGLNEAVDETVAQLPTMTELTNYRLTRAGRLEHRLGVKELPVDDPAVALASPEGELTQAISGRLLAAGGRLYSRSGVTSSWACVGSVSRYVPWGSQTALVDSGNSYSHPSCAAASGKVLVIGTREESVGVSAKAISTRVIDVATGATVWSQTVGITTGTPENRGRAVTCGNRGIVVFQDTATGNIYATGADLSAVPFVAFPSETLLVAGANGVAGIDVCPIDATSYAVAYWIGGAGQAFLSVRNAVTHAEVGSVSSGSISLSLPTCASYVTGGNRFYYLAWMDTVAMTVAARVFDSTLSLVGGTQTIATGMTDTYRPALGEVTDAGGGAIVGYTDRYTSGAFETVQTTFGYVSITGVGTAFSGPYYGYALASKPFNSDATFTDGERCPACWLVNDLRTVEDLDRSYFLVPIRQGTPEQFAPLDMSAGPSAGVFVADAMAQVSEVAAVSASTDGQQFWMTALLENFRGVGTATPQAKVQLYRFGDAAESMRSRTRAVVPCAGSVVVLGGAPRYFDGFWATEVGIPFGPSVNSAAAVSGGAMAPSKTYRYVFVLEYYDARGQRALSYVSNPYSVTLGAGDSAVDFEIQAPYLWASANAPIADTRAVTLRAYRTAGDVGTVFRFCPLLARPNGSPAGPYVFRVTGTDTNADADIAANEAVYVQVGNALSNYRAPPCRFGCEHEGRLVVAGGWNPNEANCSKLFFPGEAIQFTGRTEFSITVPEEITGCASLDGSLVLFTQRSIYTCSGDGPTDDGAGSFSPPRRLPGRVGCLDWRSVVVTEQGVMFRGADGFYLLPRGLGSPVFIGAAVKETARMLPETIGAAMVTRTVSRLVSDHDSEQVAAWLVAEDETPSTVKILTYSLALQAWSEIALPSQIGNAQSVLGVWTDLVNGSDVLAFGRAALDSAEEGALLIEATGAGEFAYDISPSFEPLLAGGWKTGKVFPFGFGGRGTMKSIRLVGECLEATTLEPTIYSDDSPGGYASGTLTFTPGRFAVEIPFRRRDLAWVQIQVADPTTGSGNRGAGLRFNGLALEVDMEPGLHRTAPGERST